MTDRPGGADLAPHIRELGRVLGEACDWTVMSGMFEGLRLTDGHRKYWTMVGPMLIGCFEQEVQNLLRSFGDGGYDGIVNVGAGEGYYAVGLARRFPEATVVAYELLEALRPEIHHLADLNGVASRCDIRGECDPDALVDAVAKFERPLVLIDIEGAEVDFLAGPHVAALAHADLIVECHDGKRAEATKSVARALAPSHSVFVAREGARDPNAPPLLRGFRQIDRWLLVWEGRSSFCHWVGARSRHRPNRA